MPSDEPVHVIRSPLPPDSEGNSPLVLRSMKVDDRVSRPFEFSIDLLSTQADIDPDDLLGKPLSVTVTIDERKRYFHGLVSRFDHFGREGAYANYEAEVRPWYWFLNHTANCRIFQDKSVPDIFEEVVKNTHGFSDFRKSLSETYNPRTYCVQYRESDFQFLSRLLEEEGIFYYFEYEEDKHTLVLGDSKSAYGSIDGPYGSDVPYRPPGEGSVEQSRISLWHVRHEVRTGTFVHDDFDFTKPRVDLESRSQVTRQHDQSEFEVFDYPGRFLETGDGERLAKVRIEQQQSRHKRATGLADHRGLQVGQTFNLTEHPRDAYNAEYVVLETQIEISSAEIEVMRADAENRFDVEFVAFPADDPFRPLQLTPKSVVRGPQTAIVVGKSGEEIWTDEYGRVKVQFHWDREGQSDEKSSCWIRVSQHWAGKTWGAIHIPRIGQEVIVDFLEGDPDRPLITGRVYNEDQKPPYDLPDNQTQSGVKSRSTKDGDAETFNELRFEDKFGEEQIYFHAEKDFERVVENNDVLKIGFEKADPGDQTTEINNDQSITVGQNRTAEIQQGNDAITVSQGNHSINVDAGESTIEAAQKITLKVGGSTITIEPASVKIESPQITISGNMSKLEGSAMTEIKGAMVKIN